MAPLVGSRVPTALTDQRTSRQGAPTPRPNRTHEDWLPPRRVTVLRTSRPYYRSERSWDFTLQSFPASERSRTRCPGPLPSRCLSHRPPPEIQTIRRSLKAFLPARVRHLTWVITPLTGRCSPGLMPLQRYSPPQTRIPSDQPSCP